ncbi:MAG TPA: Gmad2 immunoglobulin-like domain-containing protein [Anaerolineales bacterium]
MVSRYSVIFLVVIFFSGCRPATPPTTSQDQTPDGTVPVVELTEGPQTPTAAPDYVPELRNAQYQLGTPDSLQVVQLVDGKFEQGTPGSADHISVLVTDFVAAGDLNGDGMDEVAALISENYGGTGAFVFLAVYENVNRALTFLTSTVVDDRPQLNALSIENNEIFLDATIHGFEEPMCCPTLRTTRHYRLDEAGQLDMTDYTTFTPDGGPRTITIESPANRAEVFSSVQIKGSVAIAPFENNLTYSIEDVGGVELSRGAISVSAPDLGAPGTFDALIPLGNILSGALIRIEVQDISAADGSLLAMDSVELVVK